MAASSRQVVGSDYAADILPIGASDYSIDFYRSDQVNPKPAGQSRYTFNGNPVDTIKVSNGGAAQTGNSVKYIVHAGGDEVTHTLTRTVERNEFDEPEKYFWTVHTSDLHGLSENIMDTATVNGPTEWEFTPKMEEAYERDGISLPPKTIDYGQGVLEPPTMIDQGGVKTESTYDYFSSNYIPYLKKKVQTGGPHPFEIDYNEGSLPTHYVETGGSGREITWDYSGQTVTKTEKVGGTIVSKLVTTYSAGMTMESTEAVGATGSVPALVEYYPGTDPVNPWGLKKTRGFDGHLTTYQYEWEGDSFKTTVRDGGGASGTATEVTSGTETETVMNKAGYVTSKVSRDIATGAEWDSLTATAGQNLFPTAYDRTVWGCSLSETYGYDDIGQITDSTDGFGKQKEFSRDGFGRYTRIQDGGLVFNLTYDQGGQLGVKIQEVNEGRSWTETVNALGSHYSLM